MGSTGSTGGAERRDVRRGARQRLWSYLVEPDSFGLVLLLILVTMVTVAAGRAPQGRLAALVVAGSTLLYTLFTCRVRAGLQRAAWLLVGASLGFSVLASQAGTEAVAEASAIGVSALLMVATAPAIAHRVLRRPVVDAPMVSGALCLYLLLGLFFGFVFALVNVVEEGTFFTAAGEEAPVDFLYFSLVTLTTTGYGDLAARTALGRMLAVTEALSGQVYLVTVVAVLVGNIGRVRPERRGPEGRTG
jgi:Ion channel